MSNLVKILVIAAPVAAVILYFTLLKSNEISTRMNIQNTQMQRQIQDFQRDFANFDNQTYWRKKAKLLAAKNRIQQEIQKEKKELNKILTQEQEAQKELLNMLKNDNFTKSKNIPILQPPKHK